MVQSLPDPVTMPVAVPASATDRSSALTAGAGASSPLRILHVVAPADVGGLERVVHSLATGQMRRGHRVTVLAFQYGVGSENRFVRDLVRDGVDVRTITVPTRGYRRERRAACDVCRELRPDVVHTHGLRVDLVSGIAPVRLGVPSLATVHGRTGGNAKMRIYEWAHLASLRRRDAVIAVSKPLVGILARHGVRRERIHFLPNAWTPSAEPLARAAAWAELGLSAVAATNRLVGFVGRLSHEKGADVLVRAVAKVSDERVVAVVIGDGEQRGPLEALALRLGVAERVRFCGTVHDASRLLSAFDMFALPSRTEGTPIALFEAIAAGLPVIASAVGGVPDVVSEREALLVPADDPDALAAAITLVIGGPGAAAVRSSAARARLTSVFQSEPWLAAHDALYRALMADAPALR